jgi:hypothetical protein
MVATGMMVAELLPQRKFRWCVACDAPRRKAPTRLFAEAWVVRPLDRRRHDPRDRSEASDGRSISETDGRYWVVSQSCSVVARRTGWSIWTRCLGKRCPQPRGPRCPMTEDNRGAVTKTAPPDPTPLPFVLLGQVHDRESWPTGAEPRHLLGCRRDGPPRAPGAVASRVVVLVGGRQLGSLSSALWPRPRGRGARKVHGGYAMIQ